MYDSHRRRRRRQDEKAADKIRLTLDGHDSGSERKQSCVIRRLLKDSTINVKSLEDIAGNTLQIYQK